MIKIAKFGGSSVANSAQFKKVKSIVAKDDTRKIIVTSACGKAKSSENKVTDLLYLCHAHLKYGVDYTSIYNTIKDVYLEIKNNLNLKIDLNKEFNDIEDAMNNNIDLDFLVSRGEYLTAKCLAEYLDAKFVDAKDVIVMNYDGEVNFEETNKKFLKKCRTKQRIVIPGFYGSLPNGIIKVMSRGGSDITGAIIANITNADIYENWTDVSGFLVTDPHIINNPETIKVITYAELREMSYMGANVLHDEAIFPVKVKNIPINIRNTNKPSDKGTMIVSDSKNLKTNNIITGITGKKDFSIISVTKNHISNEIGFLRKALQIFENYQISVESIPISVDSFSVVVKTDAVQKCVYSIINDMKEQLHCDDITVTNNIAFIAVVGRNMKSRLGMSGKIFAELGANNINIRTINQGSDEISIIVGIDNTDFDKAIKCIYKKFIKDGK